MITRAEKTALYMCPRCDKTVKSRVDIFKLSGRELRAQCKCGKAYASFRRTGHQITVSWPCLFCGETHIKTITAKEFFCDSLVSFTCRIHEIPCLFLGSDKQTKSASEELRETVSVIMDSMDFDDYILNKDVFFETLEILDKYAETRKIGCACGNISLKTKLSYDNIELSCTSCGANVILPTTGPGDIEALKASGGVLLSSGGRIAPRTEK